ncbi:hypothetical protein [Streptomyces erythrochromogenes]|uniref:hypothetical protein n=1 Tax=Streptomyces erythrochromogenes TaxID=285574 RepID=UPI0036C26665
MATDRLAIRLECPACRIPVPMPARAVYTLGRAELHFDTAPLRKHIANHTDQAAGPGYTQAGPRRT